MTRPRPDRRPTTIEPPAAGATAGPTPRVLAGNAPPDGDGRPSVTFIGDSWAVGVGATGQRGYAADRGAARLDLRHPRGQRQRLHAGRRCGDHLRRAGGRGGRHGRRRHRRAGQPQRAQQHAPARRPRRRARRSSGCAARPIPTRRSSSWARRTHPARRTAPSTGSTTPSPVRPRRPGCRSSIRRPSTGSTRPTATSGRRRPPGRRGVTAGGRSPGAGAARHARPLTGRREAPDTVSVCRHGNTHRSSPPTTRSRSVPG